ncbi:MAG: SOS response-associated peptidase family protein [Chloroflexi bacterium]|nr:SOS response-associated peptidase family protein [Chloroflexota bacterium]
MCGAFVYVYIGGYRHRLMGGGVEAAGIGDLIARRSDLASRYNIRPTQDVVIIVSEDGRPVAKPMRWGLIPSWFEAGAEARKLPRNTFNARDDRLASSGMWRGPFKRSRGVVPATGFFEWKKTGDTKQPMYITPKDERGFMFAAVYDSWINEHGETVDSCAIVTTAPNDFMSSIHDRMPAILDEETVALWLDPATTEAENLQPVLMPSPSEMMQARPVSTRVNSYKNDDAELITLTPGPEIDSDMAPEKKPDAALAPEQLGFPASSTLAPSNPGRSDK